MSTLPPFFETPVVHHLAAQLPKGHFEIGEVIELLADAYNKDRTASAVIIHLPGSESHSLVKKAMEELDDRKKPSTSARDLMKRIHDAVKAAKSGNVEITLKNGTVLRCIVVLVSPVRKGAGPHPHHPVPYIFFS